MNENQQKIQELEQRVQDLEKNQVAVIMSAVTDANVLRAVNRALSTGTLTIGQAGTITPSASSLLTMSSTTRGIIFPRMTETERNAIVDPVEGMVIYNTTTAVLNFRNATVWGAV